MQQEITNAGDNQPVFAKSLQLCLILHDPMDCSPPGSSVHGILQARILEWVTMPSSNRDDSGIEPESLTSTCLSRQVLYHQHHLGSPVNQQGVGHKNGCLSEFFLMVLQTLDPLVKVLRRFRNSPLACINVYRWQCPLLCHVVIPVMLSFLRSYGLNQKQFKHILILASSNFGLDNAVLETPMVFCLLLCRRKQALSAL